MEVVIGVFVVLLMGFSYLIGFYMGRADEQKLNQQIRQAQQHK